MYPWQSLKLLLFNIFKWWTCAYSGRLSGPTKDWEYTPEAIHMNRTSKQTTMKGLRWSEKNNSNPQKGNHWLFELPTIIHPHVRTIILIVFVGQINLPKRLEWNRPRLYPPVSLYSIGLNPFLCCLWPHSGTQGAGASQGVGDMVSQKTWCGNKWIRPPSDTRWQARVNTPMSRFFLGE